MFFGTAADGTTHDYSVYGAWKIAGNGSDDETFHVVKIASGTFTISAETGADAQSDIPLSNRVADTITVTPTTFGSSVVQVFGGEDPFAYSPANDTPAVLWLPELGNASYVLIDLDAASGDINAVISRDI